MNIETLNDTERDEEIKIFMECLVKQREDLINEIKSYIEAVNKYQIATKQLILVNQLIKNYEQDKQ